MRFLTATLSVLALAQISNGQSTTTPAYDFVPPTAQAVYQTYPSTPVNVSIAVPKSTTPAAPSPTFALPVDDMGNSVTIDKATKFKMVPITTGKDNTNPSTVSVKFVAESGIFIIHEDAQKMTATVVGTIPGCYRLKAVITTTTATKDVQGNVTIATAFDVREAVIQIGTALPCGIPCPTPAAKTSFCPNPCGANLYCLLVVDENSKASSLVKNDAYWAEMSAKGLKWAIVDSKSEAAKPFGSEPGLVVIDMNANGVAKKARFPSNTEEMDRLIASVSGK